MQRQPSPISILPLEALRRDGGTQPRDQIGTEVAEGYAEAIADGATFPPVTAFYDGSDYWLADGFHRVAAHELLGLAEIAVEVLQGVRRDAILFSVMAHESEANARLISAAPELLAALKALVANINEFGAVTDGEFIDQADAAIAKALVK